MLAMLLMASIVFVFTAIPHHLRVTALGITSVVLKDTGFGAGATRAVRLHDIARFLVGTCGQKDHFHDGDSFC